jgi:hypothetical protein
MLIDLFADLDKDIEAGAEAQELELSKTRESDPSAVRRT